MAKGSQLSQLKSALSHAGISKQSQSGKKRKPSGSQDQDKVKKAAKLQEIQRKLNPFDVKVTKLKHDVGGRKIKGTSGRPAQSKQLGIAQREKTLLKEYEERGRAGGLVDRRFGENDPSMSLEDRMLERFTKERQKASRGAAFNLEDEEELTHYGQSLSKLDDFDNVGLSFDDDEEEDQGQLDSTIVQNSHFGGFDEASDEVDVESTEPEKKKSKAEVMAEVIAKSKEHKMRRQFEREKGENLRHQLDQDFDSLKSLLYAPDPSSTGSNSIPLGSNTLAIPLKRPNTQEMDYDMQVRELAFDKRAKPKDRTKTEEEIALEEKEALEKSERQRQRRMLGQDDVETEEEDGKVRSKRKRYRGGDDLDDDFDESFGVLGAGLDNEAQEEGESQSQDFANDSTYNDAETSGSDDDEDGDEDENDSVSADSDALEDSEDGFNDITTKRKIDDPTSKSNDISKDLPFTFPCPKSHQEFLDIVENVKEEDVPMVVQRIRVLHHPSLGPDNKSKLQHLTTILIDHILYITAPPSPRFALLSSLKPHLYALCQSYPIESAAYFVEKISLMYKNLKWGLSQDNLHPDTRTWPGLSELSFLRTIGVIWPTSDMHHPVVSPARLLMGAYLALCRVRSLSDIASGLFLCSLFLQYESLSKRLIPEVINFTINAMLHLAPHPFHTAMPPPGYFPSPDLGSDSCLSLRIVAKRAKNLDVRIPNLSHLILSASGEQDKVDMLSLALRLLDRLADMYKSLDGFAESFIPIQDIVSHLHVNQLPDEIQTRIAALQDKLGRLLKFATQARHPLMLQAHKPIPIPSYIPKFETHSSSYLRRQDPDHERNEAAKLRYQVKQERKGAIRELRKDAKFLAAIEHKKQREKDHAYKDRMNRVFNSLEGERAEQKAMDREKSRDRKRAGRK
ncbi:nucleolar protein 14 [Hygrophoropsis aurantiaca]|uniref:Nucleolar protein 14 n=1 Tax=Hygrophoropsis aurantiaca TaxID=72124 RepID=A0ACB8AIE5_9AGAM|nr:nucleolar protein 14 [Hygrophoropsis aurantiaca]